MKYKPDTRRADIADAMVGAGGKVSKADAGYGEGKPDAHCGICEHYRDHACSIVAGRIEPDDWCRYFKRK